MYRYTGRGNKFGAIKTVFDGVTYDSKLEASFAAMVDILYKTGEVVKIERQYKIPMVVNGKLVCRHEVDFKLTWKNGAVSYEEVKGKETAVYKLKKHLLDALYPNYYYRLQKKGNINLAMPTKQ